MLSSIWPNPAVFPVWEVWRAVRKTSTFYYNLHYKCHFSRKRSEGFSFSVLGESEGRQFGPAAAEKAPESGAERPKAAKTADLRRSIVFGVQNELSRRPGSRLSCPHESIVIWVQNELSRRPGSRFSCPHESIVTWVQNELKNHSLEAMRAS